MVESLNRGAFRADDVIWCSLEIDDSRTDSRNATFYGALINIRTLQYKFWILILAPVGGHQMEKIILTAVDSGFMPVIIIKFKNIKLLFTQIQILQ